MTGRSTSPDIAPIDFTKVLEKLQGARKIEDITGPGGAVQDILKLAFESMLKGEQEEHLGYSPYRKGAEGPANSRNGYSKKTLKTSSGPIEVNVPRDREGTFEPKAIEKYQTVHPELERRITSMYARGMSTRDIQAQLEEYYGTDVSPNLISRVTDKVLEGVKEWQERPLDDVYPVIFMDAIFFKIRQDGKVTPKAAYTCLGINLDGKVDVLGCWIAETEGAHFWLTVMTELKARGVQDILIACVDGLKGFPEAIASAFPHAMIQLCIVHQIRTSLRYMASKHQKEFIADLKPVYKADTAEMGEAALVRLEEKWGSRYPMAVKGWRQHWAHLSTFYQFPPEIRKMIYTTNAVEALHRQFRKVTKTKGAFPTDDALKKMLYLATLDLKGAFRSKQGWSQILGQLRIVFGERVPEHYN